MKKLHLIILIMLATSGYIFSQSCSSCRVSSFNYLKYGELDKAKETNDFCITCDKSKTDPRVWWYRGQIYQQIHISKEFKKLDPDAADKAFEAYKSAIFFNFLDPALQNLDIINKPADQIKFVTALNDMKTKYVDQEILGDIIQNQFPALANIFVNKGVEEYQTNKNYEKAFKYFSNSLFVSGMSMTVDTPVIYYAALAAQKCQKYDEAIELFKVLTQLEYGKDDKEKANNYYYLADLYRSKNDTTKFLTTLKKGIEKYPSSNSLVVELINHYLTVNATAFKVTYSDANGVSAQSEGANTWEKTIPMKKGVVASLSAQVSKGDEIKVQIFVKDKLAKEAENKGANCSANTSVTLDADGKVRFVVTTPAANILADKSSKYAIDYLDIATKNSPQNATLWFAKGSLYDASMKDTLKAVDCYRKAIEIDPKYFDANYNLGALYFNHGADIMIKANALPQDKAAEYEDLKTKANTEFNLALPYLEKAHELSPQDLPTMESLKNIYYRLEQMEKMEDMKKQISAVKK
jgi:tetratricopeptide (TPR) repeat protein